jgi:hypothetical protein
MEGAPNADFKWVYHTPFAKYLDHTTHRLNGALSHYLELKAVVS